ncbi:MAG: glycosyltransferase [Clostridia bacterium]|nr:glycosyltransferase [Clostridia bacterium]
MKVLLYFEGIDKISKSGVGMAMSHQIKALEAAGVEYTLDPEDDYDILHINTVFINSEPIIAEAKKKGAAIIYHAHSTEEDFRNSFVFSNMVSKFVKERLMLLYRTADCIIAPTPYARDLLLEKYRINAPIEVVSNGVNVNKFRYDPVKANAFREHFGFSKDDKVVIASGLWIKRKGILDFIKVAEMLPDVKFVWFGSTPLLSIPLEIRNAVTNDHPSNVFFPGYMQGDVYEGAFSSADIFFFPTYEETEGIVVLESLACSGTIVVRDIPVFNGWLKDGVNCFKGSTNEDFARLIRAKINGELPDVSTAARKTAEERDIPQIGQKLKRIYEATQEDVITTAIRKFGKENYMEKKLRIGLFSDTYPPDVNGVAVSVETLRKQLQKMGHTVFVITATLDTKLVGGVDFENGILRIPAVKIKQLYGYRISRPMSVQALEYIKNMNLDIIHINTEFTIRMIAISASKLYGIPYCYTCHTMWEDYTYYITKGHFEKSSRKMVGVYTKHLYDKDCEIIVPTKKTYELLRTYGIKKQMHIVPTGVDTARLNPSNIDRQKVDEIIESLGAKDKFRIIYVGRLANEKSLDFVIDNMPAVFSKYPDSMFIITGYGPAEDELKALVKEKNLDKKIIFLGKQQPNEIQNYFALGDVFVTASTSETQGLTYIESMAAGIPVIAKYDECLEDVLIDSKTGFFFTDSRSFLDAFDKFRSLSSDGRNEMKKNAMEKANEYSLESFGENIIKAYYRAIRKHTLKRSSRNPNEKNK